MARRSRSITRALGACGLAVAVTAGGVRAAEEPSHPASLDDAIIRAAARHGIPESLVRRIVMRESKYNPRAHNRAYWGLMQISYPTAKSMGFHGSPEELLNPVVNLRYAVPYLANAFVIAGKRQEQAVRLYAAGYYYSARTRGLLGAMRTADSAPLAAVPDEPDLVATAAPVTATPESAGIFGALFGPSEMRRDASTQQAVYAQAQVQPPYAQPASAQGAATLPAGRSGAEVALVLDRHGDLHPPKSWQRDGGTTVIARGEQAVEEIAAAKGATAADDAGRRRHARKSSQFASLEVPATAQAYAAGGGQDSRLMQADSQAAISQATTAPVVAAQNGAPEPTADDTAKISRKRHARRSRRHEKEPETAVARAQPAQPPVLSSDQQAAVTPEVQPAAPGQVADAAPQPGSPDAGAAAQSQFEQSSGAETGPSRRHKRHTRRSRGRKDTEVAAQAAPAEGQPQAVPQPATQ